jgi:amino acid adenylation domain-containing protein
MTRATRATTAPLQRPIGPEDLAYVIYTSGSTGRPKGVEIPHRALGNFLASMRARPGIDADDRLLAVTSLSFDIAGLELFLPLIAGARVEVASRATTQDGRALAERLSTSAITVIQGTPSTYRLLLDAGWAGDPGLEVLVGGEAVPRELTAELLRRCASVWNMYGPTETTIWSCIHPIAAGEGPVPIGKPIANTTAHVLDARLSLAPIGVPGELYLGGEGLARGYHARPDLTAERFVQSPFDAGARLYRTGDLCRRRPDGTLEFLGRIDQQVKLRGYRIELGEIEAVLAEHPALRAAVVLAREDSPGDKRLCAYVIGAPGAVPSAGELRSFLAARLPDYMLPSDYVALGAFPLLANGKVDRRGLPAPERERAASAEVVPRGPIEEGIAAIFAEVLALPSEAVGAHAGFFELGGHSLLGTRAIARIRRAFGVDLPLRALFEAPTPAALGVKVSAALGAGEALASVPLARAPRAGDLPLSFGEERLWFLAELRPDDPSYVVPLVVRLEGPLDPQALSSALRMLAERHELLRTTYRSHEGRPSRVIHPALDLELSITSWEALDEGALSRALGAAFSAELHRPFDLARGPLLRAHLFVLGPDERMLLLTMHHIVTDAWSQGILERELSALYASALRGEASALPELPIQYADYAVWQRRLLGEAALGGLLSYWREQLGGAPFTLDLPSDRPRPSEPSHRGGRARFALSPALSTSLGELARREGVTPYMLLLAAYAVLLHRHSGQSDLLVGTPIANRTLAETEGLIGFFVNTLVLRVRLSPALTFLELLERVKETCLGAYAHQDLPFERLVQELATERDPSRSPLYQVSFVLENAPREAPDREGEKRRRLRVSGGTTKHDLMLSMATGRAGLVGSIDYALDLFEPSTIERLLARFQTLLEGVCEDPTRTIGGLPLLPAGERGELDRWSRPAPTEVPRACLAQLFHAQAERSPDAPALIAGDVTLSYRALAERVNRLAHHLSALGVGQESRVGVALDRSPELWVAILAIATAGGAFVPLDLAYPRERLAFMIEDAGMTLLVGRGSALAALPKGEVRALDLDAESTAIDARPATSPTVSTSSGDIESAAYVIYTSGSTGTPKGVVVPHRGLGNVGALHRDRLGAGPGARVLQVSSPSFDASVWEMCMAWLTGAALVVASKEALMPGPDLLRTLSDHAITHVTLPPSALAALTVEPLPALRVLVVAGEACTGELVDRWAPGRCFFNAYGPTEVTICASIIECFAGGGRPTLGTPIPNTWIRVLDGAGQQAPIGVPGEICIGGVGLARGYLDRPELSAERFIVDPSGERLYRSGDLGRWTPAGVLDYLGRIDLQVKIRGHRIELGEVESVLVRHPALRDVVVVARDDLPGDLRLCAYFVAEADAAPSAAELRAFLGTTLPDFMLPSAFVRLEALPISPNGKVDRRALPAPEGRAFLPGSEPQSPMEELLAGIWAELLGLPEVGIYDDFFDLGGHSLLATRVLSRVLGVVPVELPLRALFEAPTVAQLAARLDEELRRGQGLSAPPLGRREGVGPRPLSFAEERLWFLTQLDPEDRSYGLALPLRLVGPLLQTALARALVEVAERHAILRTTYRVEGGHPVAVVGAEPNCPLPVTTLTALPASEREPALRAELAAEGARPFDLAEGPLLRARLFQLAEEDHVLLVTMHHIVSDGWSMGVLLRELGALYGAFCAERPSPLAALPLQYGDYAVWQRSFLQGEVEARQLAYWTSRLGGAGEPRSLTLDLPLDHPRPPGPSPRGDRRVLLLPPGLVTALRALSRREGVTLFMTLLAAFDVLLHRWSGQADLRVGSPIGNRTRAETEGLIGFFVNTLVLQATVDGAMSFRALLAQVKETCLGAYAHQDLPFERLVQELANERDPAQTPLIQVMFALQNAPHEGVDLGGLRGRALPSEASFAKYDLSLSLSEGPSGLFASMVYRSAIFEAGTIERMLGAFQRVLEGAARAPESPVHALPLLGDDERQLLLERWNRSAAPFPEQESVPRLFEAQVDRAPAALALCQGARVLRYDELEERANRLARFLKAKGVSSESLVGVCLSRSIETVIGLLGVLKAGGAYVALDPAHPPDRLAFVVEDAGLSLVLTEESLLPRLTGVSAERIALDRDWPAIAEQSAARLHEPIRAEQLAYVIYTSGSTGAPKGVELCHRGLVNLCVWHERAYLLTPDDRCTHLAAPGFDASVWEIWPPLLSGASLHLPDEETRGSPPLLSAWLVSHAITVSFLPTPLAELVLAEPWPPGGALRFLLTGGDRLRRRPSARHPFRLVNHYGPTECTVVATAGEVTPDEPGAPSIGRPIANLQAYVLDAFGQPVPVGVSGELFLGGVGLARGYLKRPELTRERFVQSPLPEHEGERLYRTGDRVRFLPDGRLDFLGRLDDQVKIRGQRVELGEIEAVLARHPALREVAVLLREEPSGQSALVAYVVGEGAPSARELREFVAAKLPPAMVPSAFVSLVALPLTPNGKIDRKALPAPAVEGEGGPRAQLGGPVEEALVALVAEVLGLDPAALGGGDDFFALGGHSLLGTVLVSRLRTAFGVELPLRALFEAPRLSALAKRVSDAIAAGAGAVMAPIVRASREGPIPASFAQERLWFLAELDPLDTSYVIPFAARFDGAFDARALSRALVELTRRHEVLRTTFATVEGRAIQLIHPDVALSVPVVDLSSCSEDEQREAITAALAELRQPFDLRAGPLLRAKILVLAEGSHLLLSTLHHIVTDAWSQSLLNHDLRLLYEAFARGEPSPLPDLPLQYADYAVWQRQTATEQALGAELRYWRAQLDGASFVLDLPADRPRPPVRSARGARLSFVFPAALSRAVGALSHALGTTPFMTLLAAFDALIFRYTGQSDVLVGAPVAGRTRAETERIVGYFINSLVLRARPSAELSFRALAEQVKEACLGAYAHQDLPFEQLVAAIAPERDRSRSPLFQVSFVLQNAPNEALDLPKLGRRGMKLESETVKVDLSLTLGQTAKGLSGQIEYSTDLFDRSTIARMVGHFETLLGGIVEAPETTLGALPLLSPSERQTLLVAWNRTETAFPRDATVHALFEAEARKSPEAVALLHEDRALAYRELDERANRLARYLRRLSAGPETRVGVALRRSPELYVALLGIWKAGFAYVPLDPSYPAERLAYMVGDAGLSLLVSEESVLDELPVPELPVVALDSSAEAIAAESSDPLPSSGNASDAAYVIYTSGSTGRPKGVVVEHRGLVNVALAQIAFFGVGPGERVLAFASVNFDASASEMMMALLAGATLVSAPDEALRPGKDLHDTLSRQSIGTVTLPPSILAVLPQAKLPALRALIVAGEPCPEELVNRWAPGRRFFNAYGPTETSICATMAECFAGGGKPSIGRPIANTEVFVLDSGLEPAPIGVPGELHVGGVGLARGYLGRPELDAEKFIPHPFRPGERLYRTGDRARRLPDGEIDYLGRVDEQVKLRGFRIELGEIASCLLEHPRLSDATVILREDRPGDPRLCAYLVPADEPPPEAAALRAFLAARLPEHMLPSAFVRIAEMPRTPNGKVDKRALPAPEAASAIAGDEGPRSPIEELLAGIFAEIFDLPEVGIHQGFFELGGHSLLATQVMARLATALGVEIPLQALFDAPTVAGLSRAVEEALRRGEGLSAAPIVPVARGDRLPLSFGQERLWFLEQLEPSALYVIGSALRIQGPLDEGALERALSAIVQRHEVLRTTFAAESGAPVAVLHARGEVPFARLDLRGALEAEREAQMRDEAAAEARRPFDLARGPLLRATLIRLGEEERVLLLSMHHIVSDGWSNGLLVRELGVLYGAFARGLPSPLSELPIQYVDYAAWQRDVLSGEGLSRRLAYWSAQLAGAHATLDLPTDHPRSLTPSRRAGRVPFTSSPALTRALAELSRREGATLFMTLLSAFALVLGRYAARDDLLIGTPVANRSRAEIEGLVGFFVNTLVLRVKIDGALSFTEHLRRVRATCLGAYAHEELPFERLVQELVPERDLSTTPLFQVMFGLQRASGEGMELSGLALRGVPVEPAFAKFELQLSLIEGPEGLSGAFIYSRDLFEPSTIERLSGHLGTLLDALASEPSRAVAELPLLGPEERRRVVSEWNDTARPLPTEALIHELIAAQAARTPDAVALVFEGEELSYGELDRRSNQLAHALRRRGVGPEVIVGICAERSFELLIGLLGILRAGGAYLPLDPDYPRERLAFMLEDAAPSVILTQGAGEAALPPHGASVIRLDTAWDDVAHEPTTAIERGALRPESLAYVLFTSGSTGRPKGAMIPHRGDRQPHALDEPGLPARPEGRVLQKTPVSFDASVWEFYAPLMAGARLVLARPEGHREQWPIWSRRSSITTSPCFSSSPRWPSSWYRSGPSSGPPRSAPLLRRRGLAPLAGRPRPRAPPRPRDHQPLRPDRGDDRLCGHVSQRDGRPRWSRSAGRWRTSRPTSSTPAWPLCPSVSPASSIWRRRRGPRVSPQARAHGRALPPQPLWRGPALSHRRRRALAARRHARVPGSRRSAGEDPRIPHRARGNRGGAGGSPGRARVRRSGQRGYRRRKEARRLSRLRGRRFADSR